MGFRSVHELYTWSACAPLLNKVSMSVCLCVHCFSSLSVSWSSHMMSLQITSLPLLLVNARDDPLVKECLHSIASDYTSECI